MFFHIFVGHHFLDVFKLQGVFLQKRHTHIAPALEIIPIPRAVPGYGWIDFMRISSGWWLGWNPSEKYEFVNWDMRFPIFLGKFKKWQPNHQPVMFLKSLGIQKENLMCLKIRHMHPSRPDFGRRLPSSSGFGETWQHPRIDHCWPT